jgi:AcrR family transcriptional regulator
MRKKRVDGQETRENLLEAACSIFAAKGFWKATIAEICRKANANTAAANYHFGSKEALYVASWRYAFQQSLKAYPPHGGVLANAPAEERLRGRILSIMRRIIDPESHDLDMLHKEMASPTGLLAEAMQESMEPIFRDVAFIVRELLGDLATEQDVRLCLMSIRAQCFGPLLRERHRKMGSGGRLPLATDPILEDVEALADHVTRFSLAGIHSVGRQIERQTYREHAAPNASGGLADIHRGPL